MTPKRSPASPSEPSPTPLFDFAADSPESTPPSAPTQAPKRGRRPKATRETEPTSAPKSSRTAKKTSPRPTKKAAADATPQELPPNERPFAVPKNWLWTRWGNCGKFVAGNAFKKEMQGFADYEIPFYKVGSLKYSDSDGWLYDETNTINEEIRKNLKAVLIPKNAIVFAKIGEAIRLNRRALTPKPCCIDNNLMSFTAEKCGCRFAYFWSLTLELYKYANATTVPAIRKTDLEAIPFPLPPLAEQARIVALIERQTRKYDEARELAEETAARIETLKKAILARAFRGELGTNDPTDPKPFAPAPTT